MSKSELHAFIERGLSDEAFRNGLKDLGPQEIIDYAAKSGFSFTDEIKGRFINRWKGVYFCPQAIVVGELCPGLIPHGYKNLIHYEGLEKIDNVNFSSSEKDYEKMVIKMFKQQKKPTKYFKTLQQLDYFYHKNKLSYDRNIEKIVNKII